MNKLFSDFAPLSSQQWKDKLAQDLKGKTFESLVSSDGTLPFYHYDTHQHFQPLASSMSWDSVQWIDGSDAKKANAQALEALQNGMNALCFSYPNDLKTLLKDILIQHIRVDFENYSPNIVKEWEDIISERGINPEDISGAFYGQEEGTLPHYFYHSVFVDDIHQAIKEGFIYSHYIYYW